MSDESEVSLTAITSGSYLSSKTAREARFATMLWLFRKISFGDSVLLEFKLSLEKNFGRNHLVKSKTCYQEH